MIDIITNLEKQHPILYIALIFYYLSLFPLMIMNDLWWKSFWSFLIDLLIPFSLWFQFLFNRKLWE